MRGADTAPPRCSSPSRKSRTAWSGSGWGADYHAPIPTLGDSVDLVAGYANVNSGTVQNLFNISGSGRIYAGRYNFGLPSVANVDQKLSLGYDVRHYDYSVVPVGAGTTIVPDYVRGLLAFYDYGRVWFNNPQPFEQSVTGISSVGPGLRVAYKANVSFRLDYGFIVQKGTPTNQDSGRPNFSLVWVF